RAALAYADALLAVGTSAGEFSLAFGREALGDRPVFEVTRHLGPPRALAGVTDFRHLKERRVPLVTAIAWPERVADDLARAGWQLAGHMRYADHHVFTDGDVHDIEQRVAALGADAVITTAKDAVKFERRTPAAVPMAVVPLEVVIEPVDAVQAWLRARLNLAAGGACGVVGALGWGPRGCVACRPSCSASRRASCSRSAARSAGGATASPRGTAASRSTTWPRRLPGGRHRGGAASRA